MPGILMTLAQETPMPAEGGATLVMVGVMIGMGLIMLLAFMARVPREWSR